MPRIRQNEEKYAMNDFVAEINAQCGRYGYRSQKSLGNAHNGQSLCISCGYVEQNAERFCHYPYFRGYAVFKIGSK